ASPPADQLPCISRPRCVLAQETGSSPGTGPLPGACSIRAAPCLDAQPPRRRDAPSEVGRQVQEVVVPVTRARIDMAPECRLIVARGTQPGATAAAGRIVREWPRLQVARPLKRDEAELIRMDAMN